METAACDGALNMREAFAAAQDADLGNVLYPRCVAGKNHRWIIG